MALFFYIYFLFLPEAFTALHRNFPQEIQITSSIVNTGKISHSLIENGYYIAVWSEHLLNSPKSGIRGQVFDPWGSIFGSELIISTSTSYLQDNPSVSLQSDGSFLVVWDSLEQDGSGRGIYGQFYKEFITPEGSEFLINTLTEGDQSYPAISGSNGYYIVTWETANEIYGQIYDSNMGKIFKEEFLIDNGTIEHSIVSSFMCYTIFKQFFNMVVVWEKYNETTGYRTVYYRYYEYEITDKTMISSEKTPIVSFEKEKSCSPDISFILFDDTNLIENRTIMGKFVIIWQNQFFFLEQPFYDIYGQLFDIWVMINETNFSIVPTGEIFKATTFFFSNHSFPTVSITKNYGFIICWQTYSQDGDLNGIFGQIFNYSAGKNGSEFQINVLSEGDQKLPKALMNDQGKLVIVWISQNYNKSGISLNCQLYYHEITTIKFRNYKGEITLKTFPNNYPRKSAVKIIESEYSFIVVWTDDIVYCEIFNTRQFVIKKLFTIEMRNSSDVTIDSIGTEHNFIVVWLNLYENNIYGQIFDIDGNKKTDIFHINQNITANTSKKAPFVRKMTEQAFLVVWIAKELDSNVSNIYGLYFLSYNKPLSSEFILNGNNYSLISNVSIDGGSKSSEILIVWISTSPENNTSSIIGTWWLILNSSFHMKSGDFYIANSLNLLSTYPSIAVNPNWPMASVIVWSDFSEDSTGENIIAQMIDSFGGKIGKKFRVNTYDKLFQIFPTVTMTPNFIFILWSSFLQDSDGFGVFAAVYDLMGNRLLNEFQINTEIIGDQLLPTVDSDSLGDLLVVWYSTNSLSLKAQKIVPDYQADLSALDTLGFELLNKINQKNSICAVLSEDGKYSLIAVSNGMVQIVDLIYLYIIEEITISKFEIITMHLYGDFVYIAINDYTNNIILLNVSNWKESELVEKNWNISWGNNTNILYFMESYENLLYLGYNYLICIYNITNASNPVFLSYYNIDSTTTYLIDISLSKYLLTIVDSNSVISTIDTQEGLFHNISSFINSVYTYTTLFNEDRSYLYVGTKSGLEVYSNNGVFNYTLVNLISLSRYIAKMMISRDRRFLSLTSPTGHYLFSLSNPLNPGLLNFLAATNKISTTKITYNSQFILMHAQSGTRIQKIITMNNFATPYLSFLGFQSIPSPSYKFLQLSPKHSYVYGNSLKNSNISSFIISNLSDGSSALLQALTEGTEPPFLMFSFDNNGLNIYEVTNNIHFTLKNSLELIYCDFLISSNQKYIYIGSFETFAILKIINVSDVATPRILSLLELKNFTAYPNLTFANSDETEIFLTLQGFGIVRINVTDPKVPQLLFEIPSPNANLNLITVFQKDLYFVTNYERIYLYNLSLNNLTLVSEMTTNGNQIFGIASLNGSYLFALTSSNLTLIDLHNMTNPVILDNIPLKTTLTTYPKVLTSAINNCIYIALIQVYCLFGSLTNYLYADITISPGSEVIEFIITFWPVGLISGFSIKLIKLTNINLAYTWINIDYESSRIKISPSSYHDLKGILQPLEAVYVTKIQSQELTEEEFDYLKIAGYIDNEYYITNKFNISQEIYIADPSISTKRLQFILSNHYNVRNYYFNTEIFLNMIPALEIRLPIQDQINKVTYNGEITIDTEFSFYLSSLTTKSHYQTTLSYSALNLPTWLGFDPQTLRFSGTPSIDDAENEGENISGDYNITVSIFNGYHTTEDFFYLMVRYYKPKLNPNVTLQSQLRSDPQVLMESQIFISSEIYIDENNQTLTYSARLNGQILPAWIQFDVKNLLLLITPTVDNFQKSYTIVITAENRHYNVSDSMSFVVQVSWIYSLQLIAQILGPLITIIGCIKYRNIIYNFFFKKYYKYPPENIYVDIYFEKEIYFIKEDLKIATLFWIQLKKLKKIKQFYIIPLGTEAKEFQETLIQELKTIRDECDHLNHIDLPLLDINGTIFTICECFLYHRLLKKNTFTRNTYLKMKKLIKKEYLNFWYLELVSLTYNFTKSRDLKYEKFPPMSINKENIEKYIKLTLKSDALGIRNRFVSLSLIYGIIKADALGIPFKPRKWYQKLEFSRGESCFTDVYEVQEIKAERKSSEKTFLMEVFGNEKLPYWIKYKIKYGILTFYGTAPVHETGTIQLLICDGSGIIIRSQALKILPAMQKMHEMSPVQHMKSHVWETPTLNFYETKELTYIPAKSRDYHSKDLNYIDGNAENREELKDLMIEENAKINKIL